MGSFDQWNDEILAFVTDYNELLATKPPVKHALPGSRGYLIKLETVQQPN